MSENTIKFAVWNIYGPPPGKRFEKTACKIDAFQREVNPDIAFYLEAPEGKSESLPDLDMGCWKKTFWVGTGQKDNPRGILVVQYNDRLKIKDSAVEVEGGVGIGLELAYGTKRIQIIGVWTQPSYLVSLKKILQECKKADFLKPDIPCIVVGDTNVNISAGPSQEDKTELYTDNISSIKAICGNDLEIWNQGIESNTWRKEFTERETKRKSIRWYRCDLMLISKGKKPVSACLGEREYRDKQGRVCGSDHRPIIFEVSVPD